MGAGVLQPVHHPAHAGRQDRHRAAAANAIEAAEQCGILAIPEVREALKFDRPAGRLGQGAAADLLRRGCVRPTIPCRRCKRIAEKKLGLLVGPEGGFSEDERRQLRALPFVTAIPLGPRILRADTAAVAALAVIQATIGDW